MTEDQIIDDVCRIMDGCPACQGGKDLTGTHGHQIRQFCAYHFDLVRSYYSLQSQLVCDFIDEEEKRRGS